MRALVVERRDIESLRKCRVGDCDLKVDRRTIELAREMRWEAEDARERAAQLIKDALLTQARAYLEQGAAAVYEDRKPTASAASGFERILRNSPELVQRSPDSFQYLLAFPAAPPPSGVECFLCWYKQQVRKPVSSIVHVCLERQDERGGAACRIAMKHVYDSHYFQGYADFLSALPDTRPGRSYLVRSVRAIVDPPRGWLRKSPGQDQERHARQPRPGTAAYQDSS
jgi:hypothetical protein